MSKGIKLEILTWLEAETAFNNFTTVVIPIGSRLKEHGHHLPLNNDWIIAEYFAERIVNQLPIILTPTVQFGFYPAFVEYPGSTHIEQETFKRYLIDLAKSFARHKKFKIYFLNTGISTNWCLESARLELGSENIIMEYTDLLVEWDASMKDIETQEGGTHADELETSLMLHIAPQIVKMHLAKKDFTATATLGPLTRKKDSINKKYSASGVWGDATLATKEKGAIVAHRLEKTIMQSLTNFMSESFTPPPAREKYL